MVINEQEDANKTMRGQNQQTIMQNNEKLKKDNKAHRELYQL